MIRVAINGFGRIGRNLLRSLYETPYYRQHMEVVAINDLATNEQMRHLLRFDSIHGYFHQDMNYRHDLLFINNDCIELVHESHPTDLPWERLDIDVVMECSGLFTERDQLQHHLDAGAKKVLLSAPGNNMDKTVVYGVNHQELTDDDRIISNASCTTNCLAPLLKVLNDNFGVDKGTMTTIHSYTGDQPVVDAHHKDLYRSRAAAMSMIPTSTGAAKAIDYIIPSLKGRMNGFAVRVPTPNVSFLDLVVELNSDTDAKTVVSAMEHAASNDLEGVMLINDHPLVSIDFNHCPASCVFDTHYIYQTDNLFKITAWYDNEWGFANRMLDVACYLFK